MDSISPRSASPARIGQESAKSSSKPSGKLRSKSELKSSIPKPTPYIRLREVMSSSSCHIPTSHTSRIPLPVFRSADRGKTSASLQYRSVIPNINVKQQNLARFPMKQAKTLPRSSSPIPNLSPRPHSASVKSPPQPLSAKGKFDCKPPNKTKLKSQFNPTTILKMKSNESSRSDSLTLDKPTDDKSFAREDILEKQSQLLNIYRELKRLRPAKDLQPLEQELCQLMQNKTVQPLDGISHGNSSLLAEGSPEFLSTFEKEMKAISESWLRLICDMASCRVTAAGTRLALPDPSSINLREEVCKYLAALPYQGESLHTHLVKIEEEQMKMMTLVLHSAVALSKEHDDLKDKYFRLEKTQDQIHYELKEEIGILGEENKELDRKYALAVEKYNVEKTKTEQLEKQKFIIHRDMLEVKKALKCWEGKCNEWESKVKKTEATCRSLELTVRSKDAAMEKEGKQHRELVNKLNESKEIILKLESELGVNNKARLSLETTNQELKDQLTSTTASLEEHLQKINELTEELFSKTERLTEAEGELKKLKAFVIDGSKDIQDMKSKMAMEDLNKEINEQNTQIQELKKKINGLEHLLKDKSAKEEVLMRQVTDLQKHPHESEVALKAQIKELHYTVKDLNEEKAKLEKIIVEKTLELDQRDLLMQEHSEVLRARDELIPMIQSKQRHDKECLERLSAVVFEHQKAYFCQGNDIFPFKKEDQGTYQAMKSLDNHYALDPKMVDKELSFRQERMTNMFSLLEHKQMEMMRLERRLQELQGIQEEKQLMEREKEACISSLQRELNQRKTTKSRGFFSLFSAPELPSY